MNQNLTGPVSGDTRPVIVGVPQDPGSVQSQLLVTRKKPGTIRSQLLIHNKQLLTPQKKTGPVRSQLSPTGRPGPDEGQSEECHDEVLVVEVSGDSDSVKPILCLPECPRRTRRTLLGRVLMEPDLSVERTK